MPIGVDLDEVLAPLIAHHCAFLNRKYGKSLAEADFCSYKFHEIYGVTLEQGVDDFYEFAQTPAYAEIEPYSEALAGVSELASLDELHVITSRQYFLQSHTCAWIHKHFKGKFSSIDFGNSFSKEGKKTSKAELCNRNNIWLLIEDNEKYALEVSRDIPVILFDKPWNRTLEARNITRAFNWRDIVDISREFATNPSSLF